MTTGTLEPKSETRAELNSVDVDVLWTRDTSWETGKFNVREAADRVTYIEPDMGVARWVILDYAAEINRQLSGAKGFKPERITRVRAVPVRKPRARGFGGTLEAWSRLSEDPEFLFSYPGFRAEESLHNAPSGKVCGDDFIISGKVINRSFERERAI
jgi:hypothetical protein